LVVVSPDAGGAKDAKKFADLIGANLAIIHKNRTGHNKAEVMNVVGDVKGKTCVMYDDMVDTAGSVIAGVEALRAMGASKDIYLAATHAVFSGPAKERLANAGFKEVRNLIDDMNTKYEEAINFGDLEIVKELYFILKDGDKFLEKLINLEVV